MTEFILKSIWVCMGVGVAILCGEVAELIVLKGPFVLGGYDSLC